MAKRISVVRNDGVIVYSNTEDFNESYSIGALVGGLWQAAEALNSMISNNSDVFEFRLSLILLAKGFMFYLLRLGEKHITFARFIMRLLIQQF